MLLLRFLRNNFLIGSTMMLLTMMSQIVNGKPQDPKIFEHTATKNLAMAGNAGMISKKMSFQMPFVKGNSNSAIGSGAAFGNNYNYDSSEEDRIRKKKRSLEFLYDLANEENLKDWTQLHRGKRSPCHTGGGGGGTGGNGGDGGAAGGGVDDDDVDIAERRRRAYARMMAARRKARNAKKTTRKTTTTNSRRKRKYLVNGDVEQTLTRRKRQSELEDLNQNMTDASKNFQQQAQQIAENIHNVFEGLMNSISEMAQKLKQYFDTQSSTDIEEI